MKRDQSWSIHKSNWISRFSIYIYSKNRLRSKGRKKIAPLAAKTSRSLKMNTLATSIPTFEPCFFLVVWLIHWHGGSAEGSAGLPFMWRSATRAYARYICLRETPPRGIYHLIYGAAEVVVVVVVVVVVGIVAVVAVVVLVLVVVAIVVVVVVVVEVDAGTTTNWFWVWKV